MWRFCFFTLVSPDWFSSDPILHTKRIPSIRSPGPVAPRDVECEGLELTYPRIASSSSGGGMGGNVVMPTAGPSSALDYDVDRRVDEAIQTFLVHGVSQIGPGGYFFLWLRSTN